MAPRNLFIAVRPLLLLLLLLSTTAITSTAARPGPSLSPTSPYSESMKDECGGAERDDCMTETTMIHKDYIYTQDIEGP
ncbi:hypothetical protein H6P81_008609 [Aristolochia fimbriata]|uniref:Phytosulfokine-beta n=1 Tax=Aristolochia fimbriata TaxID=158543 RepID=A0AAV7EJY5_ARIFI|nr:hypothetical protein H6P81_008609 [Aristolochia fimbriata]